MSQLKQDEWPADGEPTTTETQDKPSIVESQQRPSESDLRGFDRGVHPNADTDDEPGNVTPDQQID